MAILFAEGITATLRKLSKKLSKKWYLPQSVLVVTTGASLAVNLSLLIFLCWVRKSCVGAYRKGSNFQGTKFSWFVDVSNINSLTLM
jgi:hypothetical protein